MTDRELLEMAAKAAGYALHVWGTKGDENVVRVDVSPSVKWNPLTDDGDAFRLISLLWLAVDWYSDTVEIIGGQGDVQEAFNRADPSSKSAALRRAAVRAAAMIGNVTP